jgi:hypothetical protein
MAATFGSLFGAESVAATGVNSVVSGTLGIITAIVELIVAFGLWKLRPWAWLLAIVAVGLNVVGGALGMFSGGIWTFCCGLFGLIIGPLAASWQEEQARSISLWSHHANCFVVDTP